MVCSESNTVEYKSEESCPVFLSKITIMDLIAVRLNSLATPRDNMAVREICQVLNDYEAVFTGTKLKLVFKTATMAPARDQEP